MSDYDPTSPDEFDVDPLYEKELSVEEVAGIGEPEELEEQGDSEEEGETEGETTTETDQEREGQAIASTHVPIAPRPLIPIALRRPVSGRYLGSRSVWRLELRVDVDGRRPMRKVSGDYYRISGRTVTYFGSFIVNSLRLRVTRSTVTITGTARATFATGAPRIRVTIPRVPIWGRSAPARIQWFSRSGRPGARYSCRYRSRFFRTVDLEQDCEVRVTPFASYDTGSLPSGGPARRLSVIGAFAEAGIQMRPAGRPNVIGRAPGGTWSNAELHAAMERHFSLWRNAPQWKVWLFHAMKHEYGPGLRGIMFDQRRRQRQGCAVFYQRISGTSPVRLRNQLYTCVHELGHCFNLFHSFHKTYMTPPMSNRPGAVSWMNYPGRFPGGEAAYWAAFPFQFDTLETIHLRHGFRKNVIMGGNPFGVGAALETNEDFADPVEDESGLRLELRAPSSLRLGQPAVVELKLSATDSRAKTVHKHLHPDSTLVQIAIQKPNGQVAVHEPLMEQCIDIETVELTPDRPAVYDSAYIGYGKDGHYFDQPGVYRLRAMYYALDGSQVLSNTLNVRVRTPLSEADEKVAELMLGDDQGKLFYLLGSDFEGLKSGNEALTEVRDSYADHPLAVYAQLVEGFNAARPFKTITAEGDIETRDAKAGKAVGLLGRVADASEKGEGVDNITLTQTLCRMAKTQKVAGDAKGAKDTIKRMLGIFRGMKLRPDVMSDIEAQGKAALADEEKEEHSAEESDA